MLTHEKQTLRLTLFNVENLFLNLDLYSGQNLRKITEAEWRKLSASSTPNKSIYKTWALADVINDIKPDILMLNEVGGLNSLENFNKYFLDSAFDVYLKEGNSLRGIDVGYLVRKGLPFKCVLLSHKNRPINFLYPHESQTPAGGKSHYFSRDVAELRLFREGENSPCLLLMLTHLKSKLDNDRIDTEGRARRGAELRTLIELYNEIKKEVGEVPILVCGDLNGVASPIQPEPEFLPIYQNSDLDEVFSAVALAEEKRYTQVQITPMGQSQLLQIDYMLIAKKFTEMLDRESTYVYRFKDHLNQVLPMPKNLEDRSRLPSDHYPVVVTLKI